MPAQTQQEVIDYLATPAAHGGLAVERIDTHSAVVFLAGSRALKLKRAVRFDYLDFSTEPLRRAACEAEVRINRRTAPSIYRGVARVTRERNGSLALNGTGQPVDWLVDMVRFDQRGLFDRLAARGELELSLMRPLASAIATFHLAAERRDDHGGLAGMNWVIEGNATGFVEQGKGVLGANECAELDRASREQAGRLGKLLDQRKREGFVRQCHGDLHLRNIVLLEGRPTLFDAIEFNDEIACIDVLYDLAFLLMDLVRRELPLHANAVFNGYLAETEDLAGLPLLPLYLSLRAAVRAKTSATAARMQSDASRVRELQDLARRYLRLAQEFLAPKPPLAVAIGGFSGSGKSTLAFSLAPWIGAAPGALVLRSDEIRKKLCGVPAFQRLGPEGYRPEVTARVYQALLDRGAAALRAGCSVVFDAVSARPSDRAAMESAAADASAPFVGIWLDAPSSVLVERTQSRGPDASDADAAIVEQQLEKGAGAIAWNRIDASHGSEPVLEKAKSLLNAVCK